MVFRKPHPAELRERAVTMFDYCFGELPYSLTVTDARNVFPVTASAIGLTPAGVLAMSIRHLGRLPRSPWAADVLAEHLASEASDSSSLQSAVNRLRVMSPSSLLVAMARRHVINATGVGTRASYTIADDCVQAVATLETALTNEERGAIERAAHRSNAIFAAWSKASATWVSSADDASMVEQARRHAVR